MAHQTGVQRAIRAVGVIAVAFVLPEFWTAPEYLQTLVGAAVPVSLQPGDTRVVELTLKQ